MIFRPRIYAAVAAALLLLAPAVYQQDADARAATGQSAATRIVVTVLAKSGPKQFKVEVARTSAQQERGLMFRTNIPADGGMIFTPYPAAGRGPRVASFWMKNTPTALDIIFIRPNGTIESIAANAVPYSETPVRSGAPVSAVLEINAGKSAELGIAPGDKVRWTDQSQ